MGAKLINSEGEAYIHPLETRDVNAAGVIRECSTNGKGVDTGMGKAVWLDTPMIDMIHGKGTLEKRLPAMLRMYLKYGIDMREVPILIYPTLHYQNGGLEISANGETTCVKNLFVAGEAVGGIHGRNRLMGNSLLDIIVFGRNAGQQASKAAKETTVKALTLDHVKKYEEELKAAGINSDKFSPKLLPNYAKGRKEI